jgi:hypothetical protein
MPVQIIFYSAKERKLSSEKCVHACRPPYMGDPHRPCPACREWHDEAMDRSFEEYVLCQESDTFDKHVPATDREWRDHCDQVAPLCEWIKCSECDGSGVVDSGGSTPWGAWIDIPCSECNGKGLLANMRTAAPDVRSKPFIADGRSFETL